MDNKVTKKRISDHLEYDWYKYLIFVIAGIALVVFTFNQINRTKNDEDFAIFFTAYSARTSTYESDTFAAFDAETYDAETYGPNILLDISIEFQSPLSNEYGTLFSTHGQIGSDVVIVRKSYFYDSANDSYAAVRGYLELNDDILKMLGVDDKTASGYEFMCVNADGKRVDVTDPNGKIYGIRIDNLSKIDVIADLKGTAADGEEPPESEFFLYIIRDGANIGAYNPKNKKPENKQTFFCVRRLLEQYNPATAETGNESD